MVIDEMSHERTVWRYSGSFLGIYIRLAIVHNTQTNEFFLDADISGHGVNFNYRRRIRGNVDEAFIIGRHNGADIHAHLRIENWRLNPDALSFDMTLWGAYGRGPWLPAGGYRIKVLAPLKTVSSVELGAFLSQQLGGAAASDPAPLS